NDGALAVDGDDPDVRIPLLEPARYAGDGPCGADADESIVERVERRADLGGSQLVVRLHRVRVRVLVGPVGVRDAGAELFYLAQAGLQESAGVVAFLDLHHFRTEAAEEGFVGRGDVGVDHRDEPEAHQPGEGCKRGGEVPGGGLDDRRVFGDLAAL